MKGHRRKQVSLAINAIIRGLELDQIAFHYDESGCVDLMKLPGGRASAAGSDHGSDHRTKAAERPAQ